MICLSVPLQSLSREEAVESLFKNEEAVSKTEQESNKNGVAVVNRHICVAKVDGAFVYYELDFANAEFVEE